MREGSKSVDKHVLLETMGVSDQGSSATPPQHKLLSFPTFLAVESRTVSEQRKLRRSVHRELASRGTES